MPKSKTNWALIFLIAEGYSVKKLVEMGFPKPTIYNYRHKWKALIQPEIKKLKGLE